MESNRSCKRSCDILLLSGDREVSRKKLHGLSLLSPVTNHVMPEIVEEEAETEAVITSEKNRFTCQHCRLNFESLQDMREHFKSKLHKEKLITLASHLSFRQISEEDYRDLSDSSGSSESDSEPSDTEDIAEINTAANDGDNPEVSEDKEESLSSDEGNSPEALDTVTEAETPLQRHLIRHPQLFFRNSDQEIVAINKSLLMTKKSRPATLEELHRAAESLPERTNWAFLLLSGGFFAGAVFNGGSMTLHKTFRTYITRQKQGGSQSSRDNQGGGNIKSAGASLRRRNEASLQMKIQETLASWRPELDKCSHVFLRVPSRKLNIFKASSNAKRASNNPNLGPIFANDDLRLRNIPMTLKRPTLEELKRVQRQLDSVEIYDKDASLDFISMSEQRQMRHRAQQGERIPSRRDVFGGPIPERSARTKEQRAPEEAKSKVKRRERRRELQAALPESSSSSASEAEFELTTASFSTTHLQEFACDLGRRGGGRGRPAAPAEERTAAAAAAEEAAAAVRPWLNGLFTAVISGDGTATAEKLSHPVEGSESALNQLHGANPPRTLLHHAVLSEAGDVVWILLQNGCRPDLPDGRGRFPYDLAPSKRIRDVFRRFMAEFPDKFDYKTARVPGPLNEARAVEKKAKEAERRRAQRAGKREREKEKKAKEREVEAARSEVEKFLRLPDEEKRRITGDYRQSASARCFQCGSDFQLKDRFEYANFVFCAVKCMHEHKRKPKS